MVTYSGIYVTMFCIFQVSCKCVIIIKKKKKRKRKKMRGKKTLLISCKVPNTPPNL